MSWHFVNCHEIVRNICRHFSFTNVFNVDTPKIVFLMFPFYVSMGLMNQCYFSFIFTFSGSNSFGSMCNPTNGYLSCGKQGWCIGLKHNHYSKQNDQIGWLFLPFNTTHRAVVVYRQPPCKDEEKNITYLNCLHQVFSLANHKVIKKGKGYVVWFGEALSIIGLKFDTQKWQPTAYIQSIIWHFSCISLWKNLCCHFFFLTSFLFFKSKLFGCLGN